MRTLKYIGLDAQYFTASMLPHPDRPESMTKLRRSRTSVIANVEAVNKSQIQGVEHVILVRH